MKRPRDSQTSFRRVHDGHKDILKPGGRMYGGSEVGPTRLFSIDVALSRLEAKTGSDSEKRDRFAALALAIQGVKVNQTLLPCCIRYHTRSMGPASTD